MFGRQRRRSQNDREQLLLQTRETIGGLKVIIAGLRSHLDDIEEELRDRRAVDNAE